MNSGRRRGRSPSPGAPARAALLALLALGAPAHAYRIDYSDDRDPALKPCDAHYWRGAQEQARACFAELRASAADPVLRAEAAWALDDVRGAHELFLAANRATPGNARLLTRWGYLHLQTWQDQDAVRLFQEALEADPEYQNARIGIAVAVISQYRESPDENIDKILEDNAGHIQARLLQAQIRLERRDFAGALEYLALAQESLPADVPPLEIHALRAGIDYLKGDSASPWIERTLALNPRYGDLYLMLAHFAEITYHYVDAVHWLERGTAIQPENWRVRAGLGINLTRLNRIDEARGHLEAAYRGDPFNPETVNMLRLLDTFPDYVVRTVELPYTFKGQPARAEFLLRLHRDEAEVLEPYIVELLERALPIYARRYDFQPREPIVIELYPNHDDFTVRTVGSPGVGLLGVTFGYLFAMDSPGGRTGGDFHWGTTLWHELAHVFTLEASEHRIPRWFSEGLSVFEEWHSGPIPAVQFRDVVFQAINENLLLPIADLDGGFIRPTYADQVLVSYVQAGLVCDYIASRWGDDRFAAMLAVFRGRASTQEAIRDVLGIDAEQFDRDFQAHVRERFAKILAAHTFWEALQVELRVAAQGQDWQGVIDLAKESLAIYPAHSEASSAYVHLARAYRETGDQAGELKALRDFFRLGGYAPDMLRALAQRLDATGAADEAHQVRLALRMVAPQDEALHRSLAADYHARGDYQRALQEYSILLGMKILDRASVHYGMARAYQARGDAPLARRHVLMALDIAPLYREAQDLLLELTQRDQT